MKAAIIGSREITFACLDDYLPKDIDEIVSGGARGIDTLAKDYARRHGLPLTEFLPEYDKYGRAAPIRRNDEIIAYSDVVFAFWDGESHGTKYVIERCRKIGKPCRVFLLKK